MKDKTLRAGYLSDFKIKVKAEGGLGRGVELDLFLKIILH